uniref:Protein kinase domain-containing protein n=1 Tax=Strigamia maritima TaxID=126957 RepID=T1IP64_STRMM
MSAFVRPPRDEQNKRCRDLLLVPPTVHLVAYISGGLKELYSRCKTTQLEYKAGMYTDQNGCFDPRLNMPLLAKRYKFIQIIGKGQSSIIIKAQDYFRGEQLVSIKVLHASNFLIGSQEADIMLEMNAVDPWSYVPIVRLLNVFSFDDHYCLTFDLLHPDPITGHVRLIGFINEELLVPIRDVTIKLLSVLGFLSRVNIIHADLKPENILLQNEKDSSSLRVVDFGNAIRCVHEELSLYYCDYELQTLIYRAPEVLLGLSFGLQVDVWSLGCIIAELYSGQPLFLGRNKNEVLTKITSILGPLPQEFSKGEFSTLFTQFIGIPWNKSEIMQSLNQALGRCWDWKFVDFLSCLLTLSPGDRLTPSVAICHPFLASSLSYLYLLPSTPNHGTQFYPSTLTDPTYPKKFKIKPGSELMLKRQNNISEIESPPKNSSESEKKIIINQNKAFKMSSKKPECEKVKKLNKLCEKTIQGVKRITNANNVIKIKRKLAQKEQIEEFSSDYQVQTDLSVV